MSAPRWTEEDLARHRAKQTRAQPTPIKFSPAEIPKANEAAIQAAAEYKIVSHMVTIHTDRSDIYEFEIDPVSKPRQTQSDKWNKRPCVVEYRAFADRLRILAKDQLFELPDCGWSIAFHLPMPASWSAKRKAQMMGKPHQQKPDCDNLLKAVMDTLRADDSPIWEIAGVRKYWGDVGRILIRVER